MKPFTFKDSRFVLVLTLGIIALVVFMVVFVTYPAAENGENKTDEYSITMPPIKMPVKTPTPSTLEVPLRLEKESKKFENQNGAR